MCEGHCVFGSHGSAATISALLFNFGYWPESHCSPAFPNLGGIPSPGNIVYKRRHQAQQLAETTPTLLLSPTTLHPPGNTYFLIHSSLFPFTPLAISRLRLSLPVLSTSPLDYPTRESHRGGQGSSPIWPLDTRKLVWFVTGSNMAAEEAREAGVCLRVIRWKSSIWPLFPVGLSLITLSIFHDAPQDLPDDKRVDNSDSLSFPLTF